MNLIRVEGVEAAVRSVGDIPDVIVVWASLEPREGGQVSLAVYATDGAAHEIEGRGLSVATVEDNAALAARLADLFERVGSDEPPPVG